MRLVVQIQSVRSLKVNVGCVLGMYTPVKSPTKSLKHFDSLTLFYICV